MNQKSILIAVIGLFSIALVFAVYKKTAPKSSVDKKNQGEATVLGEEEARTSALAQRERLEKYYALYENPYVLHLREVLDLYLDGDLDEDSEEIGDYEVVVEEGERDNGSPSGLDSFDEDHYESKFVIMLMVSEEDGAKIITIIFQDEPDKLFNAQLVETDEDEYELRAFWEDISLTEEQFEAFKEKYKEHIEDEEHAI